MKSKKNALFLSLIILLMQMNFALALPWDEMQSPGSPPELIELAQPGDVYVLPYEKTPVSVRSDPKSSAKVTYKWYKYALRVAGDMIDEKWYPVAMPGNTINYVESKYCVLMDETGRPAFACDVSMAEQGYIYIASKGSLPLLLDMRVGQARHQLLLPNDGTWQPVLLTLGPGRYTFTVYEAGLNDSPVKPLYTFACSLMHEIPDEDLALLSGLHTNMIDNAVTVAMAKRLCEGLETPYEKAEALYTWLYAHAKYDSSVAKILQFSEIPDSDYIIIDSKGICVDYAAFMAIGLRAVGVPCKHIYGKNLRTGNQHAWNEALIDNEWQIIDVTMAQSRGPKAFHFEDPKNYEAIPGLWDGFH